MPAPACNAAGSICACRTEHAPSFRLQKHAAALLSNHADSCERRRLKRRQMRQALIKTCAALKPFRPLQPQPITHLKASWASSACPTSSFPSRKNEFAGTPCNSALETAVLLDPKAQSVKRLQRLLHDAAIVRHEEFSLGGERHFERTVNARFEALFHWRSSSDAHVLSSLRCRARCREGHALRTRGEALPARAPDSVKIARTDGS